MKLAVPSLLYNSWKRNENPRWYQEAARSHTKFAPWAKPLGKGHFSKTNHVIIPMRNSIYPRGMMTTYVCDILSMIEKKTESITKKMKMTLFFPSIGLNAQANCVLL